MRLRCAADCWTFPLQKDRCRRWQPQAARDPTNYLAAPRPWLLPDALITAPIYLFRRSTYSGICTLKKDCCISQDRLWGKATGSQLALISTGLWEESASSKEHNAEGSCWLVQTDQGPESGKQVRMKEIQSAHVLLKPFWWEVRYRGIWYISQTTYILYTRVLVWTWIGRESHS